LIKSGSYINSISHEITMEKSTRRGILQVSSVIIASGVAGCSGIGTSNQGGSGVQDTDGDGVIDSEDYAPRDPEVQREEQINNGQNQQIEQTSSDSSTTNQGVPAVLNQPLPHPQVYISSDRGGDIPFEYDREIGNVEIDTESGVLTLRGPGDNKVTAIAGFISADDLAERDNWGGYISDDSKKFGTNATNWRDKLDFRSGTFRGIALRAMAGINLTIDGSTVAESVRRIKYTPQSGIIQQR
jgi:hypothetical protein